MVRLWGDPLGEGLVVKKNEGDGEMHLTIGKGDGYIHKECRASHAGEHIHGGGGNKYFNKDDFNTLNRCAMITGTNVVVLGNSKYDEIDGEQTPG